MCSACAFHAFSLASQCFMAVKQDVPFPGTANSQASTFSVLYVFLHNNLKKKKKVLFFWFGRFVAFFFCYFFLLFILLSTGLNLLFNYCKIPLLSF